MVQTIEQPKPETARQKPRAKRSTQGPFAIWHGMNVPSLCRFLAKRPKMHWSKWMRLALLPPMSIYNSTMSAIESLVYGRKVARTKIEQPPVFVLGYWRSGTTLLHNLLACDPQFSFPNTYQTLFPTHFLLTGKWVPGLTNWMMPKTRPMDNMKCGWETPMEDDVAQCTMSMLSPYALTALSEDPEKYQHLFELSNVPPSDIERWKEILHLFMRKLTVRTPNPLVMKSPVHTYRIPHILDLFPEAKFFYIYRNPYRVFNSGLHLRRTMIIENGLGQGRLDNHEDEVIHTYQRAFEIYERDRQLIPPGNLHEVRFEDLEVDPVGEMKSGYEALGLDGFETLRKVLEPQIPQLQSYKKNKFVGDPEWMKIVYDELREAFDRFGYDSPLDDEDDERSAA